MKPTVTLISFLMFCATAVQVKILTACLIVIKMTAYQKVVKVQRELAYQQKYHNGKLRCP